MTEALSLAIAVIWFVAITSPSTAVRTKKRIDAAITTSTRVNPSSCRVAGDRVPLIIDCHPIHAETEAHVALTVCVSAMVGVLDGGEVGAVTRDTSACVTLRGQ